MGAQEDLARIINRISDFLLNLKQEDTVVPVKDFEPTYKQLRGIKDFWDTGSKVSWEEIESIIRADWIKEARSDKMFRRYYKLRMEVDRLEKML